MRILVACEQSGVVREAFSKLGWEAWSCDLQETEVPGNHYQGNVFDILHENWDLIIAHPPCTHLAVSGAKHFSKKKSDGRQQEAIKFFMEFTKVKCLRVAIENPVGIKSTLYRKPSQIIQPWQFGDSYQKTTCLWLKNLPRLKHTNIVDRGEFVTTPSGKKLPKWYSDNKSSKSRSRTFQGVADAMALQWSSCLTKRALDVGYYPAQIELFSPVAFSASEG